MGGLAAAIEETAVGLQALNNTAVSQHISRYSEDVLARVRGNCFLDLFRNPGKSTEVRCL